MQRPCRIGTRKSALARTQSTQIADRLMADGLACELVEMSSDGDRDKVNPLYAMENETPGLFCKQLEEALLADEIDIAVHSLKDLPTTQPKGLFVAAISTRVIANDVLIIHPSKYEKSGHAFFLSHGARVGTSSLRREAMLLEKRPDLQVRSLRGNVPSRVRQVQEGKLDAAVLAAAGIYRLGLELKGLIKVDLKTDIFIPAPGQGALAIEARESANADLRGRLAKLDDPVTRQCVRIERRIMRDMEGGCTLPLGVFCQPQGKSFKVWAFLGVARNRAEGRQDWVSFHRFDISDPDEETLVRDTVRFFEDKK